VTGTLKEGTITQARSRAEAHDVLAALDVDPGLPVRGLVVNQHNNVPLAGVAVDVYAASLAGIGGDGVLPDDPVGHAITDADGRFEARFERSPEAEGIRILLRRGGDADMLRLLIRDATTRKVYGSFDVRAADTFEPRRLEIALPRKRVTATTWQKLGRRMEETRTVRLHDVAQRIASPGDTSLGDWDLETRQAILLHLESDFLDPTGVLRERGITPTFRSLQKPGEMEKAAATLETPRRKPDTVSAFHLLQAKVTSFDSVFQVGWVVDPQEFEKGDPGTGMDKFRALYFSMSFGEQGQDALAHYLDELLHKATDRSRYRDYLRTIYTGPSESTAYPARRKKLETRFHQDMQTVDDDDQPANAVVIPILTAILQAPTGAAYGFGIAASSIKQQGALSNREYLDYLIGLTGVDADQLRRRYRISFSRPDSAVSSRVRENITALQGFYADGSQSIEDPYPLYGERLHGKAPFFLEYEEWLALNGPFYGENQFQIQQTFRIDLDPGVRAVWEKGDPATDWLIGFVLAENKVNDGYKSYSYGQFGPARTAYDDAEALARAACDKALKEELGLKALSAEAVLSDLAPTLQNLAAMPSKGVKDVIAYMDAWVPPEFKGDEILPGWVHTKNTWVASHRKTLEAGLFHFLLFVLPVLRGDLELAAGDYMKAIGEYEKATRFLTARADLLDSEGYNPASGLHEDPKLISTVEASGWDHPGLYRAGQLPYTTPRSSPYFPDAKTDPAVDYISMDADPYHEQFDYLLTRLAAMWAANDVHPIEARYLRLRHGIALLELADALYRTDEPSSIRRARELYKEVLWLHGEWPPIAPYWPGEIFYVVSKSDDSENPATASQKARARLGFAQIEDGLNYYGLTDAFVPSLRYRPLKDAADRYTASAKAAQQDFLLYEAKVEEAIRDMLIQSSMLKKAKFQHEIADEQVKVAQWGVKLAQHQIDQVKKAIKAKEDEIADNEDFFHQLESGISGMKKALEDVPGPAKQFAWQGLKSELGIDWMGGTMLTGAAAGGAMMAGYGLFVYAGYTSLSAMAAKANDLQHQLNVLNSQALPLAQGQFGAAEREVTIAKLNGKIAQVDAALAQSLLQFQTDRFLNTEFWAALAAVMRRVMQRFLTLAARFAWLAERALAYEQDRRLSVIRFDYSPKRMQGVTGADLLQLDLGELEAVRLEGVRQTIPIRWTTSLAFDDPIEFARLKSNGRCLFFTQELPLRLAYPGTYGYRIRDVNVKATGLSPRLPARGMLTNSGVSLISRPDGKAELSLRPQEGYPLSEFQFQRDMDVFGLPNEALTLFEGSGIETLWSLELPPVANPDGLAGISDIQITFDLQAQYSPELSLTDAAGAQSTQRYVLMSAQIWAAQALDALRSNGSAVFELDPRNLPLPAQEKNRTLTNALLFVAQASAQDAKATVKTASPGGPVIVTLQENTAISNAPPFVATASTPASPLNALVGRPFDQLFILEIQGSGNADFSAAADVVLGLEYKADL
jgi:Tc toxin complex TcA C-terminal TcB-binding domain